LASISSGILCDFAQVRDGLLFVASGGVTRAFRPELPAGLGVMLGLLVELPPGDIELVHELTVVVKQNETAEDIARFVAGVQAQGDTYPGEALIAPLVLDLRNVPVEAYGSYDIRAAVDGELGIHLTFYVADKQPPGA
jgi:hypothetical protein